LNSQLAERDCGSDVGSKLQVTLSKILKRHTLLVVAPDILFTHGNTNKENRQTTSTQINMEEDNLEGEETNGHATKLENNVLPSNKELSNPNLFLATHLGQH